MAEFKKIDTNMLPSVPTVGANQKQTTTNQSSIYNPVQPSTVQGSESQNKNSTLGIIGRSVANLPTSIIKGTTQALDKISDIGSYLGNTEAQVLAQRNPDNANLQTKAQEAQKKFEQASNTHLLGNTVKAWQENVDAKQAAIYEDNPNSKVAEYGYKANELAESMGAMAPTIAASLATSGVLGAAGVAMEAAGAVGQAAGLGLMWANVYSSSIDDSVSQGYDYISSSKKAFGDATLEVATELMFAGIAGTGKGAISSAMKKSGVADDVVQATLKKSVDELVGSEAMTTTLKNTVGVKRAGLMLANAAVKFVDVAENAFGGALGEALEEMTSEALSPFIERWTTNPEAPNASLEQIVEAGIGGAIMSVGMIPFGAVSNKIVQNQINNQFINSLKVDPNKQITLAKAWAFDGVQSSYADIIEEKIGSNLTDKESIPASGLAGRLGKKQTVRYDSNGKVTTLVNGLQSKSNQQWAAQVIQNAIDAGKTPEALTRMWSDLSSVWAQEANDRADLALKNAYENEIRNDLIDKDSGVVASKKVLDKTTKQYEKAAAKANSFADPETLSANLKNAQEALVKAQQEYDDAIKKTGKADKTVTTKLNNAAQALSDILYEASLVNTDYIQGTEVLDELSASIDQAKLKFDKAQEKYNLKIEESKTLRDTTASNLSNAKESLIDAEVDYENAADARAESDKANAAMHDAQKKYETTKASVRNSDKIEKQLARKDAVKKYGQKAVDAFLARERIIENTKGRIVAEDADGNLRVFNKSDYAKFLEETDTKYQGMSKKKKAQYIDSVFEDYNAKVQSEIKKFVEDVNKSLANNKLSLRVQIAQEGTKLAAFYNRVDGNIYFTPTALSSSMAAEYFLSHEFLHYMVDGVMSAEQVESFYSSLEEAMGVIGFDFASWEQKIASLSSYNKEWKDQIAFLEKKKGKQFTGAEKVEYYKKMAREETFARFMSTAFGSLDVLQCLALYSPDLLTSAETALRRSSASNLPNTLWDYTRLKALDNIQKALATPTDKETNAEGLKKAEVKAEADAENLSKAKPKAETKVDAKPKAEANAEPKAKAKAQPKEEAKAKANVETKVQQAEAKVDEAVPVASEEIGSDETQSAPLTGESLWAQDPVLRRIDELIDAEIEVVYNPDGYTIDPISESGYAKYLKEVGNGEREDGIDNAEQKSIYGGQEQSGQDSGNSSTAPGGNLPGYAREDSRAEEIISRLSTLDNAYMEIAQREYERMHTPLQVPSPRDQLRLQYLVYEAARVSGFSIGVFHSSWKGGESFTEFSGPVLPAKAHLADGVGGNQLLFFADTRKLALTGSSQTNWKFAKEFAITLGPNPYGVFDAKGASWAGLHVEDLGFGVKTIAVDTMAYKFLNGDGYTGIEIDRIDEGGFVGTDYIVTDPSYIRSLSPMVVDNQGNVIDLKTRFSLDSQAYYDLDPKRVGFFDQRINRAVEMGAFVDTIYGDMPLYDSLPSEIKNNHVFKFKYESDYTFPEQLKEIKKKYDSYVDLYGLILPNQTKMFIKSIPLEDFLTDLALGYNSAVSKGAPLFFDTLNQSEQQFIKDEFARMADDQLSVYDASLIEEIISDLSEVEVYKIRELLENLNLPYDKDSFDSILFGQNDGFVGIPKIAINPSDAKTQGEEILSLFKKQAEDILKDFGWRSDLEAFLFLFDHESESAMEIWNAIEASTDGQNKMEFFNTLMDAYFDVLNFADDPESQEKLALDEELEEYFGYYEEEPPYNPDDYFPSGAHNIWEETLEDDIAKLDEYQELAAKYGTVSYGSKKNKTFKEGAGTPNQLNENVATSQTADQMLGMNAKDENGNVVKDENGNPVKKFANLNKNLIDAILSGQLAHLMMTDENAIASARTRIEQHKNENGKTVYHKTYHDAYVDAMSLCEGGKILNKNDIVYIAQLITDMAAAQNEILEGRARVNEDTDTTEMVSELEKLIASYCAAGTRAGQNLQAFSLLKKLTPTGRLYYIQSQTNQLLSELVNRKGESKIGGAKFQKLADGSYARTKDGHLVRIQISDELVEMMENAKTPEEMDYVEELIIADIAKEIPPTLSERVVAWRYLAMLGNPRTHIRNIVSNAVMGLAVKTKGLIGAGIEDVAFNTLFKNLDTQGGRTKTLNKNSESYKALKEFATLDWDRDSVKDIAMSGGKVGFQTRIQQARNKLGFKNFNILETIARKNSDFLEKEDDLFGKKAYIDAFASYCTANGLTPSDFTGTVVGNTKLSQARAYAINEAAKATYHDANIVATMLNQMEKKTGVAGKIIIGGLVPFKKTPGNILKRGVEYSPIGLAEGIYKAFTTSKMVTEDMYDVTLKNGEVITVPESEFKSKYSGFKGQKIMSDYNFKQAADFQGEYSAVDAQDALDSSKATLRLSREQKKTYEMAQAIDLMASGLTGTGLMLLGLLLARLGILHGAGDENDREKYYDQMLGTQEYSIDFLGNNYTLDWLTPVSMPLFAGVAVHDLFSDSIDFNDLVQGVSKLADPVMNLSVLSGINDALSSYDSGLGKLVLSAGESYIGQFIPTIAGQVARTIDPTRRTTYAPKDSDNILGKDGATFLNKLQNKIPFASKSNAAYVDMWGRTETDDSNIISRFYHNGVAPYYKKEIAKTSADDAVSQVFQATGDRSVIPTSPESSYTFNNNQVYLTSTEYERTKKMVGQISYQGINSLVEVPGFDSIPAETQADLMAKVYSYARKYAKDDYAKANGIAYEADSATDKITDAVQSGMTLGGAIYVKYLFDNTSGDKNAKGNTISGSKKKNVLSLGQSLGMTQEQIEILSGYEW